jgi:hypothetical protein
MMPCPICRCDATAHRFEFGINSRNQGEECVTCVTHGDCYGQSEGPSYDQFAEIVELTAEREPSGDDFGCDDAYDLRGELVNVVRRFGQ